MTKQSIDVVSDVTNKAVVIMPGRAFPGLVVQGDSLSAMESLARSARDRSRTSLDRDLAEDAEELYALIRDMLLHYQSAVQAAGLALPYGTPLEGDE